MSEDNESVNSKGAVSVLEKHIQSLILAAMTAMMGWLGITVQDSTLRIATLTEKVSNVEKNLAASRDDLYTKSDHARDQLVMLEVMDTLRDRIIRLEDKVLGAARSYRDPQ